MGCPGILTVLGRWGVQSSSPEKGHLGMLAIVRRGGVQSFFHRLAVNAGAPTIRHGGPVLAHQQIKNAFAGKPKASNRYLCSNGLEIVLAVDFGYCYNYQSCLNETYRCNLVQQHVRYACTRKHTLAAGVEISAVLSTLLPLQMH